MRSLRSTARQVRSTAQEVTLAGVRTGLALTTTMTLVVRRAIRPDPPGAGSGAARPGSGRGPR
ncbi:unannotated protein [freshwater metagenome]|uniref:Unannotated protein n=1 Tax=freshwater metagenome TaxID=449393 RepID=A0A6J6RWA5_9ZZZZ|nr:hypothetical protein [Nocardioides sp.]